MIIPNIIDNLNKYGISPSLVEQRRLLLKQNKQLVNEINKMKSNLDVETYTNANIYYKKIIKNFDVRLFRNLLKEQYLDCEDYNIDIYKQIIFNKKIRNIIKHIVLKKFSITLEEDPEVVFTSLIEALENLNDPAKEDRRCFLIEQLVNRKSEFINRAKRLLVGGGEEDYQIESLDSLFVFCVLEMENPNITELCNICITFIDKNSVKLLQRMYKIIKDQNISSPEKGIYLVYIVKPSTIDMEEIKSFTVLNKDDKLSTKKKLFLILFNHNETELNCEIEYIKSFKTTYVKEKKITEIEAVGRVEIVPEVRAARLAEVAEVAIAAERVAEVAIAAERVAEAARLAEAAEREAERAAILAEAAEREAAEREAEVVRAAEVGAAAETVRARLAAEREVAEKKEIAARLAEAAKIEVIARAEKKEIARLEAEREREVAERGEGAKAAEKKKPILGSIIADKLLKRIDEANSATSARSIEAKQLAKRISVLDPENLIDLLRGENLDSVIQKLEKRDITKEPLSFTVNGIKEVIKEMDKNLYVHYLKQYRRSIQNHTIESLYNERGQLCARIIFGTYIQLIISNVSLHLIYKIENIKYQPIGSTNTGLWQWKDSAGKFINFSSLTFEPVSLKPIAFKPVPLITSDNHKIESFHKKIISLIQSTFDYQNFIVSTKSDTTKIINTAEGERVCLIGNNSHVYLLFNGLFKELGWYLPINNLYFVKVTGDINNITFVDNECPYVEIIPTIIAGIMAGGGAYYKKYMKYKNKYISIKK